MKKFISMDDYQGVQNRRTTNIAKRLRKLLMNYELAIAEADSQINLHIGKMKLLMGKENIASQKKFILEKVEVRKYEMYKDELLKARSELLERIDIVLGRYYNKKMKEVFFMHFIQQKTVQEIGAKTNLTSTAIEKIVSHQKNELLKIFH